MRCDHADAKAPWKASEMSGATSGGKVPGSTVISFQMVLTSENTFICGGASAAPASSSAAAASCERERTHCETAASTSGRRRAAWEATTMERQAETWLTATVQVCM